MRLAARTLHPAASLRRPLRLQRCDACFAEFEYIHRALGDIVELRSQVRQAAVDLRLRIEQTLGIKSK